MNSLSVASRRTTVFVGVRRRPQPCRLTPAQETLADVMQRWALGHMTRLNLPREVTDHGQTHVLRVMEYLKILLRLRCCDLNETEKFELRLGVKGHDVGQAWANVDPWTARQSHHIFSYLMITAAWRNGVLPFENRAQALRVAELARCHNVLTELPHDPRLRVMVSYLRVADVMDITYRRATTNSYGERAADVRQYIWSTLPDHKRDEQLAHWQGHDAIRFIRVRDGNRGGIEFQIGVSDKKSAAFQIDRFQEKVAAFEEVVGCVDVKVCAA